MDGLWLWLWACRIPWKFPATLLYHGKKQQFSFTEPDGLSKLSKLSTTSIEIYIYICEYMYIIILDTGHLTLADDFMMRKNPERGYAKAWLIAKLCKIAPSILFPYQGFRCHPFI